MGEAEWTTARCIGSSCGRITMGLARSSRGAYGLWWTKVAARLARFPAQDLKYRRLDEHLTVLHNKLAALAQCILCAASLYTQWHILAECPHPDLRSARLEVAVG